jgi:plastocyanin domain-containing protein
MNNNIKLVILAGLSALAIYAFASASPQRGSCCGDMGAMQHEDHHTAKAVPAKMVKGVQKAAVTIDGGYKPGAISVKAGKPVELTFKLGANPGCGDVLVIKELKFKKELKSGKPEVVKFTPKKAGEIGFECGMGMLRGKIVVTGA